MIRFSCSHCQAVFEVDDSLAGRAVDCGQCRHPMTVPAQKAGTGIQARKSTRQIRFTCPHCQTFFEVDSSLAGRAVDCGQCKRPMSVPNQSDAAFRSGDPDQDLPSFERDYIDDRYDRSVPDIRRYPGQSDPTYSDLEMTPVDWVLCTLCAGIGCLVGLYLLSQGKPKAGKMVAISILSAIIWTGIRLALSGGFR